MQKIEYKELPSPHVVIENFLPTPAARDCLTEAQWLEPIYEAAQIKAEANGYDDGCDDCNSHRYSLRTIVRNNKLVFLDNYYEGRRHASKLLVGLQTALVQPAFINAMRTFPGLFPIVSQTTHMETVLSSYGMCDFYGWHKDIDTSEAAAGRVITLVLHLNTEPQEFVGGELILTGKTIEDQLPYQPVHNRAILFQSNQCVHAVDETKHEGDFKDNRFSINLWLGFDVGDERYTSYRYR